jgi:hypothetical protein
MSFSILPEKSPCGGNFAIFFGTHETFGGRARSKDVGIFDRSE